MTLAPPLYADSLVRIFDDRIVLLNYYFPTLRSKTVMYSDIRRFRKIKPTIWTGKYRFHGTGNFLNWFPNDPDRSKRAYIYKMYLKSQWIKVCFTVVDPVRADAAFAAAGLVPDAAGGHPA